MAAALGRVLAAILRRCAMSLGRTSTALGALVLIDEIAGEDAVGPARKEHAADLTQ